MCNLNAELTSDYLPQTGIHCQMPVGSYVWHVTALATVTDLNLVT